MTADTTASPSGAEPRAFPSNRDADSTSSIRTRTPGPTMTSRPASRAPCDGAGRHDGNIRCPSPNIA
jgi:hypothetical protein